MCVSIEYTENKCTEKVEQPNNPKQMIERKKRDVRNNLLITNLCAFINDRLLRFMSVGCIIPLLQYDRDNG